MAEQAARQGTVSAPSPGMEQRAAAENVTRIEPERGESAESRPPEPVQPPKVAPRRRPRRRFVHTLVFFRPLLRLVLMVVLPLIAAFYGAIWWGESMRYVTTENAYVKADVIAISADIDGRIAEVLVKENERVRSGQVLLRIDTRPFAIALQESQAELERVATEIEAMRADYRGGLRELRARDERVRYLEGEFDRQDKLTKRGVGTGARLDEASHELEMAKRERDTMVERNRKLLAELVGKPDLKVEEHPRYLAADANVDRAKLNLSYATVTAPTGGIVGNVKLQSGEYIETGDALFSLVQVDHPWIEANLKETQLTDIVIGQKVGFVVDSYPDVQCEGRVASIAPATGAEFSLLPPQNASGNWVKVVQRVPVRLAIGECTAQMPFRAGMTVSISIDTERDRSLGVMTRELVAWLGLAGVVPESWLALLDEPAKT
jgi:membrane fusion protein (multidrug efflux system)